MNRLEAVAAIAAAIERLHELEKREIEYNLFGNEAVALSKLDLRTAHLKKKL